MPHAAAIAVIAFNWIIDVERYQLDKGKDIFLAWKQDEVRSDPQFCLGGRCDQIDCRMITFYSRSGHHPVCG